MIIILLFFFYFFGNTPEGKNGKNIFSLSFQKLPHLVIRWGRSCAVVLRHDITSDADQTPPKHREGPLLFDSITVMHAILSKRIFLYSLGENYS